MVSFSELPREVLQEIESLSSLKDFLPGQKIFRQFSEKEGIYFLIKGKVGFHQAGKKIGIHSQIGLFEEWSNLPESQVHAADAVAELPTQILLLKSEKIRELSPIASSVLQDLLTSFSEVSMEKTLTVEIGRWFDNNELRPKMAARVSVIGQYPKMKEILQLAFKDIEFGLQDHTQILFYHQEHPPFDPRKMKAIHFGGILNPDNLKKPGVVGHHSLQVASIFFNTSLLKGHVEKILSMKEGKYIWGAAPYFTQGVTTEQHALNTSLKRSEILQKIDAFLEFVKVRSFVRTLVSGVAEELMMNMLYDAPSDDDGEAKYNHLERTQEITLSSLEQGIIEIGKQGPICYLTARDPFGSLTKDIILSYFEKSSKGEFNKDHVKGGAGLGLGHIIQNSDAVIFQIKPRKRTEVICFFHLDQKEVDKAQGPSLFIFEI